MKTHSSFTKGKKTNKEVGFRQTFSCSKSGYYEVVEPIEAKKKRKTQKLNALCPAKMIVESSSNGCSLLFISTHLHDTDAKSAKLHFDQKLELAEKLQSGIPTKTIKDDYLLKLGSIPLDQITRGDIITTDDLYQIKKTIDGPIHSNDLVSTQSIIASNTIENGGNILYSNIDTESKEKVFEIVIMSEKQKEMLFKYGRDCVMIDTTFGVNQYSVDLTTLVVFDYEK